MALFFYYPTFEYLLYIWHFSNGSIGCDTVLKKGKFIYRVCPFCNFVRNKIYVLEVEVLGPVVLASKHTFSIDPFSCYTLNVSAIFRFEANHNIL